MAIVTPTRTYNTGDSITADYYNQDRDEIIAGVNSIDNAQIAPAAAIVESKIAFTAGGHGHSGGTDGKQLAAIDMSVTGLTAGQFVRVNAGGTALETAEIVTGHKSFSWYIGKDPLVVADDESMNPRASDNLSATKLSAYVKTPATGADLIVRVSTVGGTQIASLTIPAGSNSAETTSVTNPSITEGTYLRIDVTQIGSSTAGAKVSATLDCIVV